MSEENQPEYPPPPKRAPHVNDQWVEEQAKVLGRETAEMLGYHLAGTVAWLYDLHAGKVRYTGPPPRPKKAKDKSANGR